MPYIDPIESFHIDQIEKQSFSFDHLVNNGYNKDNSIRTQAIYGGKKVRKRKTKRRKKNKRNRKSRRR